MARSSDPPNPTHPRCRAPDFRGLRNWGATSGSRSCGLPRRALAEDLEGRPHFPVVVVPATTVHQAIAFIIGHDGIEANAIEPEPLRVETVAVYHELCEGRVPAGGKLFGGVKAYVRERF